MRETSVSDLPQLWSQLAELLAESTDPYINVPFTKTYDPDELKVRPPAPSRLRTHAEYQAARMRDVTHAAHLDPQATLRLDVGAWVPDRLLDDSDTVVVDIHAIIAAERIIR